MELTLENQRLKNEFKALARSNSARDTVTEKIKANLEKKVDAKVTDAQLKKMYNEYKEKLKGEKEVKAKHILVDSESKAKEVISKLKKGGDFDKLAKQYSK